MNEHMHVCIENPNAHRKELLSINMGMIDVLQHLEKIKRIRIKKSVQINKLNMLAKRISRDVAAFRNELPREKELQFMKRGVKMQKISAKIKKEKEEVRALDTDKLSMELRKLKEKIDLL